MSRSNAGRSCEKCNGNGFLRDGLLSDFKFVRCPQCGGIGFIYLDPAPAETPKPGKSDAR